MNFINESGRFSNSYHNIREEYIRTITVTKHMGASTVDISSCDYNIIEAKIEFYESNNNIILKDDNVIILCAKFGISIPSLKDSHEELYNKNFARRI